MNKRTYLVKVAYLIDLTEDEYRALDHTVMPSIKDEIILKEQHKLTWESSSAIMLDPTTVNCGRCSNCNAWATDREKPNHIDELNNGATVEGRLLCDECLPEDHRWAF